MTSMELRQEFFRQIAVVSDDEGMMRKAVKALKRIAKKEEQDATEEILASPAMMDIIRKGDEEISLGNVETTRLEELWK